MPIEFKQAEGVSIAVLPGTLDSSQGEEFVSQVEKQVPKGGKLIVDGSGLRMLTQQGVLHLINAQRWVSIPERKRLLLVGFNPTVWRAIVENGSDFFFDSKGDLAEALRSLNAPVPSPAPAPANAEPAHPAPAIAAPPPQRIATTPRPSTKADPFLQPQSTSAPVPPPFQEPTPLGQPAPVSPFAPQPFPNQRHARSPLGWIVAAVALILGAAAIWWLFGAHAPTVAISASATTVEEDGKEVDEVTAQVQNGRLSEKSWADLPKGMYFDPPLAESSSRTYTLRGRAEAGTKNATVKLEAVNDSGQRSAPVLFTVNVQPKPMSWQINTLQTLRLKVGERLWYQAKFVVNANEVSVKSGMPPGLVVERIAGKERDWQMTGTPTAAGKYRVVFEATAPTGKQEEQSCALVVTGDVEPPKTAPRVDAEPTARPVPRALPVANLDDGMRRFLLERIENLPSRYTEEDREDLRAVVGTLRQARLIARVVFAKDGQTDLSPDQSIKLKTTVKSPENIALLRDPACQIVVVGYATRTGSQASNVRISKLRARAVNEFLRGLIGHSADLCGDYGPTDVVDQLADEHNRAVEVYAGIIEPSSEMMGNAERFKQDFNRRHGIQ